MNTSDVRCPGLLLTVDPGLRACGLALFRDDVLVAATAVRGLPTGRGPAVWKLFGARIAERVKPELYVPDYFVGVQKTLLVETMHVYREGKGDPDDLLELAGIAGAVVASLPSWTPKGVRTSEWNGQVPPEVRRARTRAWVEERGWLERVDLNTTARFQQDVWSAIGMGRWRITGLR